MSAGKLLTIEEYLAFLPEADALKYGRLSQHQVLMAAAATAGRQEIIVMGMLRWNDETAYLWSSPYPGNFVLIEATKDLNPPGFADGTGKTFREIARRISSEERWWSGNDKEFVQQFYNLIVGVKNDDYKDVYQFLIDLPDDCRLKNRIKNEYEFFHGINAYPTREYPYRIFIRGTDDGAYSKTFPDKEKLLAFLEEIVEMYSVYPQDDGLASIGMEFLS